MPRIQPGGAALPALLLSLLFPLPSPLLAQAGGAPTAASSLQDRRYGAFAFQDSVLVPLRPESAFDRFVDVNAWWDHRFSPASVRFSIDARPGGAFLEVFDDSGDGVLHATVIFVRRGEILRLDGPLGLSGFALPMVFTLTFRGEGDGTWVRLDARGAGEMEEAWPAAIQGVWRHFLHERYRPFAEGGLGGHPGS
jgi:hypothetical protein